jgi:hypothetical protein
VIAHARARVEASGARVDAADPRGARRRPAVSVRVVCDASALVALLLDAGPDGRWATHELSGGDLAARSLIA